MLSIPDRTLIGHPIGQFGQSDRYRTSISDTIPDSHRTVTGQSSDITGHHRTVGHPRLCQVLTTLSLSPSHLHTLRCSMRCSSRNQRTRAPAPRSDQGSNQQAARREDRVVRRSGPRYAPPILTASGSSAPARAVLTCSHPWQLRATTCPACHVRHRCSTPIPRARMRTTPSRSHHPRAVLRMC